ncbi:MAG: hypothetical protein H7339_03410 [Arcicella sp.]|nr:hypothetical protein [Arcicella sp.]
MASTYYFKKVSLILIIEPNLLLGCEHQKSFAPHFLMHSDTARVRGRMGGSPKGLSPRYQEIAPMVVSAYKEQRSIRDIMKAFSIPSTTTVYKILTDNNVPFQVYKKAKENIL